MAHFNFSIMNSVPKHNLTTCKNMSGIQQLCYGSLPHPWWLRLQQHFHIMSRNCIHGVILSWCLMSCRHEIFTHKEILGGNQHCHCNEALRSASPLFSRLPFLHSKHGLSIVHTEHITLNIEVGKTVNSNHSRLVKGWGHKEPSGLKGQTGYWQTLYAHCGCHKVQIKNWPR